VTLSLGANGKWVGLTTGSKMPHMKKPFVSEHPVLSLALSSGRSREFYLLIKSEYMSLSLLLRLMAKDKFIFDDAIEKLYYGGFYAVLVIMALYNLILAISLRNTLFAKLSAILIFYAIGESGAHLHLAYIVLPSSPMVDLRMSGLGLTLASFWVGAFAADMLKTKRYAPRLHIVIILWMLGNGLCAAVILFTLRYFQEGFWFNLLGFIMITIVGLMKIY
jgi:hypothetical protein